MKRTLYAIQCATMILATALIGGAVFTSCEERPKTLGEKIEDGLDARPNEKLKDTAEDAKEAVKDAVDGK